MVAVGLVALAGVLAGCGGTTRTPAPQPTGTPSQSPSPTQSPFPSPSTTFGPVIVEGRPTRRGKRVLAPGLRAGRAGVRTPVLPIPSEESLELLPASARRALGERWGASARGELGSIPAFAELSVTLSALGAPLDLIARCHQAAIDEVDHTRRALAIAGAYQGVLIEAGAMPGLLTRRRRVGGVLAHLAAETLRDGCLLEAYAAKLMHIAATEAADPALAESLAVIAEDETGHGELSWDILAWCLEAGGPWVQARVAWTLARLPRESGRPQIEDCDPVVAAQHGWPREAYEPSHFHAHRTEVMKRAALLLREHR